MGECRMDTLVIEEGLSEDGRPEQSPKWKEGARQAKVRSLQLRGGPKEQAA